MICRNDDPPQLSMEEEREAEELEELYALFDCEEKEEEDAR